MKFLYLLWNNRTKLIGYLGAASAALAVADPVMVKAMIGEGGLAWVMFGNGLLIALVGHHNSRRAK